MERRSLKVGEFIEWAIESGSFPGRTAVALEARLKVFKDRLEGLVKSRERVEKWSEAETDLLRRLREEKSSLGRSEFVKWAVESGLFPGRTEPALLRRLSRLQDRL
jgi:hypothetical protein